MNNPETISSAEDEADIRPRVACLVSFWGRTSSHADWLITKLIDGYWWNGKHTPSRVRVASVYIHQYETSLLGQKVARAKGIPVFQTVAEALTLGGKELSVDGVVIVGEHGNYPVDLKGRWLLPRWWIFNQVIRVFEQGKRSVPVFNDKHLSYNWNEAKWIFDKSRELNFPLSGGSSIPTEYREPEVELADNTPIKYSVIAANSPDEGALFHSVDLLQSFVERRKGGETGVKSVQWIKGKETWNWTQENPWADRLLDAIGKQLNREPGYFRNFDRTNVCVINYNDGTRAAIFATPEKAWRYACEIEGRTQPTFVSAASDGFPYPFGQYHGSNTLPHWITQLMLSKQEPFNAARLLLSTGIVNHALESNWENGKYNAVGRQMETPFLNMSFQANRPTQFVTGTHPPTIPYLRGFDI